MSGVNASHTNVKEVTGSDAYVKPILPGDVSHTDVNPACVKADFLCYSGDSDFPSHLEAVVGNSLDDIWVNQAPDVGSDS